MADALVVLPRVQRPDSADEERDEGVPRGPGGPPGGPPYRALRYFEGLYFVGRGVVDQVGGGDVAAGAVGVESGAHDGAGIDRQGLAGARDFVGVIVAETDHIVEAGSRHRAGDGIV